MLWNIKILKQWLNTIESIITYRYVQNQNVLFMHKYCTSKQYVVYNIYDQNSNCSRPTVNSCSFTAPIKLRLYLK